MTIEQAKLILRTYTLPMTPQQMREYKMAFVLVSNNWGRPLGGN